MRRFRIPLTLVLSGAFAGCSPGGCPGVDVPEPTPAQAALLDPDGDAFAATPPDTFVVRFTTSRGDVEVEVVREWTPIGAGRLYNLVRNRFFDGNRFFRVLPGFIVQFGVHGVPAIQAAWNERPLPDDPVIQSNVRGTLVYATAGPDTRTTQLFFNYLDNPQLDHLGFAPVGRVRSGMDVLIRLYSEYGETQPDGAGPDYGCMLDGGEAYLERSYPRLDRIETAVLVQ